MNDSRNGRHLFLLVFVLSVSILAACSAVGGKTTLRPEAQQRAVNLLERGLRSQQKGETGQAEQLFLEALAGSSAIEDNPTRIIVLVNLARLNRLNGSIAKASEHLDQALSLCSELPEFMTEAAYEKAHLELALDNLNGALIWAVRSLDAENGSLKGVRRNLLARIQLATGSKKAATLSATAALQENQRNSLEAEEANSLRMLGTIELENQQLEKAGMLFREALEIDKKNGLSAKIGLDLEKLAEVADRQGDVKMESEYLERASSVYLSGRRREKAAETLQKLVDIHRKTGNAVPMEKARQTLERLKSDDAPYPDSAAESARPSNKP